ncbi:MAG: sialidase family protein [candidate division WOR-3 bacterium]
MNCPAARNILITLGITLAATVALSATRTDTVGFTSVDHQNYGPIWQRIFHLIHTGIHVSWVKTGMAANHYDFATGSWHGETNVFGSLRNASGNLAVPLNPSPYYGSTFICSWLTRQPRSPVVAVESIAGSGNFTVRAQDSSLLGCQRAVIAFTNEGTLHMLCSDSATGDTLLYSRSTDYGISWSAPLVLSGTNPPVDPSYNIAASDSSARLAAVWSIASTNRLYVNISDDAGITWSGVQALAPVPTSIPQATSGRFGAYALFDALGRLNLITQVWNGTSPEPAEIWHWQEGRNPEWTLVFRYDPAQPLAQPEPGEPFLIRPSLAVSAIDGRLIAGWMNYDSLNYEPRTQISRADIFVSQSFDHGISWSPPLRLTGPDAGSRISPCLAADLRDTLILVCITDQIAGVFENGHGTQTVNSVNVLFVPLADLPAVTEPTQRPRAPAALPSILRPGTGLLTGNGNDRTKTVLLDAAGRTVAILSAGSALPERLPAGVYFALPCTGHLKALIIP